MVSDRRRDFFLKMIIVVYIISRYSRFVEGYFFGIFWKRRGLVFVFGLSFVI